jgi:hypothetical protein
MRSGRVRPRGDGDVQVFEESDGRLSAYSFSGGEWSLIGEVTGAAGDGDGDAQSGGGGRRETVDGVAYDQVLDVDVDEGRVLRLGFNWQDNPYETAAAFCAKHMLPTVYDERIGNYIADQQAQRGIVPAAVRSGRPGDAAGPAAGGAAASGAPGGACGGAEASPRPAAERGGLRRAVEDAARAMAARGAAGAKALKICRVYVRNARDRADGEGGGKFLRINLGNKAFAEKVRPFEGSMTILGAAGFERRGPTGAFPEGSFEMGRAQAADKPWLSEIVAAMEAVL